MFEFRSHIANTTLRRSLRAWFFALGCLWSAHSLAHLPDGVEVQVQSAGVTVPLQLTFVYTNTSSREVRFLRWGTALEGAIFEDILDVTLDGRRLPYVGPVLKRRAPTNSDYVSLAPLQARSVTVPIESVYDFGKAGTYQLRAKGGSSAEVVELTLATGRQLQKQQPLFQSCTSSQAAKANAALSRAESISRVARDDLQNTPTNQRSTAPRYLEWFGSYAESRWNEVQDTFNRIYSAASGNTITFDCACREGINRPEIIAYVFPSQHYDIYLCSGFFFSPVNGSETQGGIIVHELSHFFVTGDTEDHVYGFSQSKNLAATQPNLAANNADNFLFFAENPTDLSMPTGGGGNGGAEDESSEPPPPPEPEPDYSWLGAIYKLLLMMGD